MFAIVRKPRPFWFWPALLLAALIAALLVATWLVRPRQPVHDGRALLAWVADLESPRAEVRAAAEQAIRSVGAEGVPALVWALRRGDSLLGRVVVASEKSLPRRLWLALLRTAKPSDAPRQRAAAARALGLLGPAAEPALPVLSEALRDRELRVVSEAASAMAAIGPAAVPLLAAALAPASDSVRSYVLFALGRLGPAAAPAVPAIVHVLVTATDHNAPLQAAQILTGIGLEAMPAMVAALPGADATGRERLETALAELASRQPAALDALESELRRAPPELKPALLRAVGQVSLYPRRRALIVARTLDDPDPALRAAAGAWLRQHSSPAELERPLAGEPESLRQRVAEIFRPEGLPPPGDAK